MATALERLADLSTSLRVLNQTPIINRGSYYLNSDIYETVR